jgi:hypothetical protein
VSDSYVRSLYAANLNIISVRNIINTRLMANGYTTFVYVTNTSRNLINGGIKLIYFE